jgi:DNA-binding response OmpR family regulator
MEQSRILIVEDDHDLLEMLSAFFRMQKYEVLTADTGAEALRISLEEPPDLAMLDIRLPDIDGYEICRQLRSQRATKDTPIIFLTEKRDRVDKLQGLELGVVDYITKPFDVQELQLRVRNTINRASRESLMNAVTDLPEGALVEEKLNQQIYSDEEWAVLALHVSKLGEFRDLYGFVAADEVLRAIALMIRNMVRDHGSEDNFIGQLAAESFLVITTPAAVKPIRDNLATRIQQSREYFYPVRDRQKVREGIETEHLRLTTASVSSADGPFATIDALMNALGDLAQAES